MWDNVDILFGEGYFQKNVCHVKYLIYIDKQLIIYSGVCASCISDQFPWLPSKTCQPTHIYY